MLQTSTKQLHTLSFLNNPNKVNKSSKLWISKETLSSYFSGVEALHNKRVDDLEFSKPKLARIDSLTETNSLMASPCYSMNEVYHHKTSIRTGIETIYESMEIKEKQESDSKIGTKVKPEDSCYYGLCEKAIQTSIYDEAHIMDMKMYDEKVETYDKEKRVDYGGNHALHINTILSNDMD